MRFMLPSSGTHDGLRHEDEDERLRREREQLEPVDERELGEAGA